MINLKLFGENFIKNKEDINIHMLSVTVKNMVVIITAVL